MMIFGLLGRGFSRLGSAFGKGGSGTPVPPPTVFLKADHTDLNQFETWVFW